MYIAHSIIAILYSSRITACVPGLGPLLSPTHLNPLLAMKLGEGQGCVHSHAQDELSTRIPCISSGFAESTILRHSCSLQSIYKYTAHSYTYICRCTHTHTGSDLSPRMTDGTLQPVVALPGLLPALWAAVALTGTGAAAAVHEPDKQKLVACALCLLRLMQSVLIMLPIPGCKNPCQLPHTQSSSTLSVCMH